MKYTKTSLEGVFLLAEEQMLDERGYFSRMFCKRELSQIGFEGEIVQVNHSFSKQKGTLRGLHYQIKPFEERKIVSCIQGKIWDVVVDLRKGSKTFLEYVGETLSPGQMIVVPKGCAHGFISLEEDSEIMYFVTEFYHSEYERGIRYDDPRIGIQWPIPPTIISKKDLSYENSF